MITKEKGYSLNVLVITIAVMLILTSTAIVTLKSLTKDRDISEFMNDIQEVEDFVMAYYMSKNILPVAYDNNGLPRSMELPEEIHVQANEKDKGEYYVIDLSKLDSINLFDYDRGGYLLNENTLKVYVLEPVEYEGIKYYTLTDEILGVNRVYGSVNDFEISITGNPITWTSKFNLLVSIPDVEEVTNQWTFKYCDDGPITAEQFTTKGSFFEYGEPIEITKNGIHSIYVDNASGEARVVNVIVNKIDDIEPYVYVNEKGNIVVGDDELGIARIHYKIMDFSIPVSKRLLDVRTYVQGERAAIENPGNAWTLSYEDAYTGSGMNAIDEPDIGRSILTYASEYQEYLNAYSIAFDSGDVSILDDVYPQFQKEGVPYSDDAQNIVIYIEDYAGNSTVTDKNNTFCVVSRETLLNSHFIDDVIKPLRGAEVVINKDEEEYKGYTKSREVELTIRAQGAEQMYISTDGDVDVDALDPSDWQSFETEVTFTLPEENGEVEVYVYVTANQYEDGALVYQKVSDSIYLDLTPPTNDKPEVEEIGNDLMLYVTCKQNDNESGIKKVEYGYKLKDDLEYKWSSDLDGTILEELQIYHIRTRVMDKAGNQTESEVTQIQCPKQLTRTVPNEPAMATGMKAIVWDGTFERPTDELEVNYSTGTLQSDPTVDVTWYNYEIATGVNDTKKSIWANAKTSDGSYWVWIPRYAYKIIYYTNADKNTVSGYYQNSKTYGEQYFEADGTTVASDPELVKTKYLSIEIIFMNGNSGTQYREENIKTHEITLKTLPEDYIVHPAFLQLEASSLKNVYGKWSTGVTGIWVSKFEMSRADATIESQGSVSQIRSIPSVRSYTNLTLEDAYVLSKKMFADANGNESPLGPHLMKNSEWGAVAYLAHSAYGRNGAEPKSNRNSDYITGGGGSGTSAYTCTTTKFETTYAYNARATNAGSGLYASTTGNVYGIYDMLGGAAEFVAMYLENNVGISNENALELTRTSDPAYREVYPVASNDQPVNNYNKLGKDEGVYGNAIFETSKGYTGNNGINSDATKYPYQGSTNITRGGNSSSGSSSGLFNFECTTGAASEHIGFRTVLALY